MSSYPKFFFFVFGYTGNVKLFNTERQVEETWNDRGRDGRTSFINEHATRINLHEHEDDEKGNELEHIVRCRETKSCEVEVKI